MGKKLVLITRPEEDAAVFAQVLEGQGISSLIQPMLDIQPVSFELPDLSAYQGLIFTSANGVRGFAAESYERAIPAYTVGKQTESAARAEDYSHILCAEGVGEDLAALIQAHALKEISKLLHIRGQHVAYPLAPVLQSKGYSVDELIVYEAFQCETFSKETHSALQNEQVQAVTFFSKRTAEAFIGAVDKGGLSAALAGIKALCISESVLNCVRDYNWQDAYAANTPDQDGVVQLVAQHCREA